jgi:uncharacterized protein YbaP (TraB family)
VPRAEQRRVRLARTSIRAGLGALLIAVAGVVLAAQDAPRHFLWKVISPTGGEAYLLGSVHVLTKTFYPLSPVIERAFASSKVLVEEVDLDEMNDPATMMGLVGKAMLPDGQTLDQVVSKDTFAAIRARAEENGVPMLVLQRMKPWMAAVALTASELTKAGFDSALGIDRHFYDRAKAAGMPRRALETVAYQFDRLDGLSADLQEASLKAMLADIDAQATNVETLAEAWRRGDTLTLERLLFEGFKDSPEVAERLLGERNRNWVAPVEKCLAEQARCFVVVGAAHLVGPDSLVQLLRARKHSVEQQ